ncbi:MAG: hypothetical protein R3B69_02295 [Candidatus Paceibacterota bacterium]
MTPDTTPILELAVQLIILLSIIITIVYVLVVGYHWFSYGSSRKTNMTALAIFLGGTGLFVSGMVVSYFLMF